ncbi:MAG: MFS transporter, partial [Negativicutes bacterium]|nr:MFS transporter [Negativicutes bacterium]
VRYGVWSISHYVGEAVTFIGTAIVVSKFGWQSAFTWAGVTGIVGAYLVYKFMYDRPQVYGLPSVIDYKGERPPEQKAKSELSIWEAQKLVLKNPYVWLIGISASCMGIVRYAINSWGIIFLQETKGLSLVAAGSVLAVTPIMGALGSAASGFIATKIFRGRSALTTVLFSILLIVFLALFCFAPAGNITYSTFMLGGFGFSLGVLLCFIGGLLAVELSPTKAAGAAMGTIGLLAYIGAMVQDIVNGILMDAAKKVVDGKTVYNFDDIIGFWLGASAVMLLFVLPSLWAKKRTD